MTSTTTRSDFRHFCALFILFVVVVLVSSFGGLYLYLMNVATCDDLGHGLAQLIIHIRPDLDRDKDGNACEGNI